MGKLQIEDVRVVNGTGILILGYDGQPMGCLEIDVKLADALRSLCCEFADKREEAMAS